MSYGSGLVAEYPASYGQSTLPNFDPNARRSKFDNSYQSNETYRNEDAAFNQMNHDPTAYHPPSYFQNPSATNSRKSNPSNQPVASLNEIPEYEESLATASSVARSMNNNNNNHANGPMNKFVHPQQNPNRPPLNDMDINSQSQPNRNVPQTKTKKQSDETKTKSTLPHQKQPTTRTQPVIDVHKRSLTDEGNDDGVPVQSSPSVNIEAWLNETEKESPVDKKPTRQAWPVKTNHSQHIGQNQRDKPSRSKTLNNKPIGNKTKPIANTITRDTTYEIQQDPYFDGLVDEDLFPKSKTSSLHQPTSTKNHLTTNTSHHPSSNNTSKYPKSSQYEPPSPKRAPTNITTTSWRKQDPTQNPADSMHLDYSQSELTHRDLIQKDTDERFREALQQLRADRAKQQKELSETTAKRLQYGDYVRHSSKDELLQNVVKPSPWADFMELKKGNLVSLSKEEKKQLYDQSRSYGERIRYRNYDIWYEGEVARSLQQNAPRKVDIQKPESSNLTPRQIMNNGNAKSVNRTSKQREPESKTTNKIETKHKDPRDVNQMKTNQQNRTNVRSDRSTATRLPRNESDHNTSRHQPGQQQRKKKQVRYAKYDSAGRETSGIDDSDDESDYPNQRAMRVKPRNNTNNLYTLHEEKSFEDTRYKKR